MMDYQAWKTRRHCFEPRIEKLVIETETACTTSDHSARAHIVQRYSDLSFSDRVWNVYFANTERLAGVKRIDGRPYATHPTRMALTCLWLGEGQEAEEAAVAALLHDYLEESGGVSAASYADLKAALPCEAQSPSAAVLLSEPEIDYSRLGPIAERSVLRRAAYIVQATDALQHGAPACFADAMIADKLDNLHDLAYLEQDKDQIRRNKKIAERLAFFGLTRENIEPFTRRVFCEVLREAIHCRIAQTNMQADFDLAVQKLSASLRSHQASMRSMIAFYHRNIGIAA